MQFASSAPGSSGGTALPKPPGAFERFGTRHPRMVDGFLAFLSQILFLPIALIALATVDASLWEALLVLTVSVGFGVLTYFRRTLAVILPIVASALSFVPMAGGIPAIPAIAIGMYTLGAYRPARVAWLGFCGVVLAVTCGGFALHIIDGFALMTTVIGIGFSSLAALALLVFGMSIRARRQYIAAIINRGDLLERERDQQAQLAAASERARIAREMHDVVSHGITVMVTLAQGAAAQTGTQPKLAATTMNQVADTGREALSDMRRMLGILAEPGAEALREPQPDSADLHVLVEKFRSAGMPVRWTTRSINFTDRSLTLAVHRIMQEALTNVLRHAPDATFVAASVIRDSGVVTITVDNDGGHAEATTVGSGRGLIGMRARAASFNGTVDAGQSAHGWRVSVTLQERAA